MKNWNFFIIIVLFALLAQNSFAQEQTTPPEASQNTQSEQDLPSTDDVAAPPEEDETKILDEVEVNDRDRRRRFRLIPPTGALQIEPLPVRVSGRQKIYQHAAIDLILRPIRPGPNGLYVADDLEGFDFKSISVELGIGKRIVGTRLPLAKDGKRTVDLPEGVYAITEVRYLVFNQIGRVFDDDPFGNPTPLPREDYRFCLADRTIAFDIKNGQTTDIGRLIIRALESRFRNNKREHRPFVGSDAAFVDISDPSFRNKSPDAAGAGIVAFERTGALCREGAYDVSGWFSNEELAENLPTLNDRLNEDS